MLIECSRQALYTIDESSVTLTILVVGEMLLNHGGGGCRRISVLIVVLICIVNDGVWLCHF